MGLYSPRIYHLSIEGEIEEFQRVAKSKGGLIIILKVNQ